MGSQFTLFMKSRNVQLIPKAQSSLVKLDWRMQLDPKATVDSPATAP